MAPNGHPNKPRFNESGNPTAAMPEASAYDGEPAGPEAAKRVAKLIGELKAYYSYLVSLKLDKLKLTARTIGIYAVLGIVGLLVAFAAILIAVSQVLGGIAGGLGELTDRPWVGELITGAVVLVVFAVGVLVVTGRVKAAGRRATLTKYMQLKAANQAQHGRDVQQAAGIPK